MGFGAPPKIKFRPSFSFENNKFPRFNLPTIERIRSPLSATVSPSATPGLHPTRNPMERVKGYFDGLKAPGLRDEDDVEKQSMVSVDMRDNLLDPASAATRPGKVEELRKECAQVLDGIGVKGDKIWQDKRLLGGGLTIVVVGTLW
ncbi:MAG: hypothetical protein Q9160_006227 [Pyrenula sp. 1 TL-2023]